MLGIPCCEWTHDWNFMPITLDHIDKRILRALQRDGRLQNVELAKEVGLSPSPCLRRVRRLEDAGIIQRYTALLDASKIGISLTVFARVSLVSQDAETVERFAETMRKLPQVVECHIMAGECDALLRVVATDLDSYRQFQVAHLNRKNGVQIVKTDIPMQKVKLSTELPL
jgi:DNA-binding Lrp family transcriptional regulator